MKPQIAVLVDGDQLGPEGMPGLMERLAATWTVTERVCVRNWRSTRDQQAWREFSSQHSFRLVQRDPVAAGKNASDIELTVVAMDLLAAGHRAFCLVSGDMDFTPLVDRLRRGGCEVEWVRPSDLRVAKTQRGRTRRPAAKPAPQAVARGTSSTSSKPTGGPGTKATSRPSKPATRPAPKADTTPAKRAQPRATAKAPAGRSQQAGGPDVEGLARAVRRIMAELRRSGEHERGWVSVNRVGGKLTEAGTSKDDFGFPKRRPLWAALEEAGFTVEQMETGQYRLTLP